MSEQYACRMETARILVADSAGKPVKNKRVRFRQTQQEFLLGAGAFDTLKLPDPFYQERVDKWLKLMMLILWSPKRIIP